MSADSTTPSPRYLLLGEILRPHGVRGEVRMRVLTDYPERIGELEQIYLSEDDEGERAVPYAVDSVRMHQDYALLKLTDIDDRDAADRLRQLYVLVELENAVPLDEGEFYLYQLIGVTVVTEDGTVLGELVEVIETGANDVYVINGERYGTVLLPAIESVVLKTDIAARTMIVRPLEGMLPA